MKCLKRVATFILASVMTASMAVPAMAADTNKVNIKATSMNEEMGTVTGSGQYDKGTQVTVQATAKDGYEFKEWVTEDKTKEAAEKTSENTQETVDVTYIEMSKNPYYTFTADKDVELKAVFEQKQQTGDQLQTVTPATQPETEEITTVTPAAQPETEEVPTVTPAAQPETEEIPTVDPAVQPQSNDVPVVDPAVQPVEKVNLTVVSANETMGTVTGSGEYEKETEVKLTATAKDGYEFVNWTDKDGNVLSTEKEYIRFVKNDETITANFKAVEVVKYNVTVQCSPAEGGTATGANTYAKDSQATVTAAANNGYKFVCWTDALGQVVSYDTTVTFTVVSDNYLTANFAKLVKVSYSIAGDDKYGTPSDAGFNTEIPGIQAGTDVNLSGVPATQWKTSNGAANGVAGTWTFSGWYTEKELKNKVTVLSNIKNDTTVYGKWTFTLANTTNVTHPKTGDTSSNLILWVSALGISTLLFGAAAAFKMIRR